MRGEELLGTKVGNIRLVELLARGGMGTVYAGNDEKLRRRVALKAIRPEFRMSLEHKARLIREARILSQLRHPHICQIYDYLEVDQGEFLVLELVEGTDLRAALRSEMPEAAQMRVARQLTEVLIATHERGVVHRDLKPGNVMVTGDGDVKVLDFGLSWTEEETPTAPLRGLEPEHFIGGELDEISTQPGVVLGTLEYLSPERVRGQPATPASDMYAVGLLLDELFTGRRPPANWHVGGAEGRRGEGEASVAPAGLDRDLGALIARLKSVEPGDRPSARETAARLRWIVDKPSRRFKKVVVVAIVLGLAVIAGVMSFQAWRIGQEAQRANREAAAARETASFLVDLFEVSDPGETRGSTVTAREILDLGAQRIDAELADQPVTRARLMETIGTVYRKLGLFDDAARLLEEAVAARERGLGPRHPALAATLNGLGVVYVEKAEYDRAEEVYRRAVEIFERTRERDELAYAHALNDLATLYAYKDDFVSAEPLFQRALEIREREIDGDHQDLAESHNNLAYVYQERGEYQRAEPLYRRALEIWERSLGDDHPRVATSLNNLAALYRELGDDERAGPLYRRALEIREKTLGPDHPRVATSLNNLAGLLEDGGDLEEAEALYLRSVEIKEKALGPDHPSLARSLGNLAGLYVKRGEYDRADPLYQRALGIVRVAYGDEHTAVARGLSRLAALRRRQGRDSESESLFRRAGEIAEARLEHEPESVDDRARLAYISVKLGTIAAERGDTEDAAANWLRTVALLEPLTADSDDEGLLQPHVEALLRLGRVEEARPLVERLLVKEIHDPDLEQLLLDHRLAP